MLPGSRNWEDAGLRSAGGGTGTDTSHRPRLKPRTPLSASLEAGSQVFHPPPPCSHCYHCITVPLSLPPSPALQTWCLSSGCLEVTGAGAWDERSSLGLAEWETRDEPAAPRSRAVLRGQSRGLTEIQKQGNVFGLVSDFWGVFFLAYLPPPPCNCRLLSFVFVSLRMQRRDLTRS